MDSVVGGIVSSLIATIIWALLVLLFSPKFIRFIKKMMVSLMDSGTAYIFKSYKSDEFIEDLDKEIKSAKRIWICASRGTFLMEQPYRKYLNQLDIPICVLLPDINSDVWLKLRTKEVSTSGAGYTEEAFKEAITSSCLFLKVCKGKVKLKSYNCVHIGRLIMTDRVAYFVPYLSDTYGEDVAVYKYTANSTKYKWVERIFMEMWESQDLRRKE